MSQTSEEKRKSRMRWVTLGEAIAIAALIVSGLGLYREWKKPDEDGKGTHSLRARITAQYVEAGADKSATGNYTITYKWEGGGLLGGKSLRLTGMTRG